MVFHATSGNFCNSVVKCLILLQSDLRGVLEICKNQFTVRNMKWVIYFSKVHIAENVSESSSHLLAGSLCTVRCSAYMYNVHAARHLVAHRCSALEIFGIFCHCYIAQIRWHISISLAEGILFRTIWVCAIPNNAYSKHLTDIHISERRTTRSCVCFALSCPLFNSFQILWPVMLLLIPLLLIVHAANCGHFLFWLPMRFAMFLHVSICFLYDNLQCFLKFIDPKISSSAPRVSR